MNLTLAVNQTFRCLTDPFQVYGGSFCNKKLVNIKSNVNREVKTNLLILFRKYNKN